MSTKGGGKGKEGKSREGKSKTTEEDVDENGDEAANESKWRTSLRKKISRLGRKARPMSWSIDNSSKYNDTAIGLSSQSLFSPCDTPPINNIGRFDRNRKTRSFLFPSSSFREGGDGAPERGFFRKMFSSKKKDNLLKMEGEKNNVQTFPEALKCQTLDSISERKSSKGSVKSDITGSNHLKHRLKNLVTKGSMGSGILNGSTVFRDRVNSQDLKINGIENCSQVAEKRRSLSNLPYTEPLLCDKRHSSVDCYRKKDFIALFEDLPAFNGDGNSIRYIDSSSDEDIQSHLHGNELGAIEESPRNSLNFSPCETSFSMPQNDVPDTPKGLDIKEETIVFANCTDRKPPDKVNLPNTSKIASTWSHKELGNINKDKNLQLGVPESSINSCHKDNKNLFNNQYKHEDNSETLAKYINHSSEYLNGQAFERATSLKLEACTPNNCESDNHVQKYLHPFVPTNSVFSNACLCDQNAGSTIDTPSYCNMQFCRGNNIFILAAPNVSNNNNNYECQMHYVIESGIITSINMSNVNEKFLLEERICQGNEGDIYYCNGQEISLKNEDHQFLFSNYKSFTNVYDQRRLKVEGIVSHNYIYDHLSELNFVKLYNTRRSLNFRGDLNTLKFNSINSSNFLKFIAFNDQFCNEMLKPNNSLLKVYSLINEYYDKNAKILQTYAKETHNNENNNGNSSVTPYKEIKENEKKTELRDSKEKTENEISVQESLRKSKRKRKRRKGKNGCNDVNTILENKEVDALEKIQNGADELPECSMLLHHSSINTQHFEVVECFDVVDTSDCAVAESSITIVETSNLYPVSGHHAPSNNGTSNLYTISELNTSVNNLNVLHFAKENYEFIEYESCQENIPPIYYVKFKDEYQRNKPRYEALSNDLYEECKYLDIKCNDNTEINKTDIGVSTCSSHCSEDHQKMQCPTLHCDSVSKTPRKLRRSKSLCQTYLNCRCADDSFQRNWRQCCDSNLNKCNSKNHDVVTDGSRAPTTSGSRVRRHRFSTPVQISDCRTVNSCDADSGVDTDGQKDQEKCSCCTLSSTTYPFRKFEVNRGDHENENKSVRWLLCEAEDILASHQVPENTLSGVSKQVDRFHDFFSFAKFESEKSLSLLPGEEHFEVCSEASEDTQDLAKNLRRHITSFADRLHLTKDRLEDTAKCYLLLDKAYEWALEAMKIVGRVKSSGTATVEQVGAAADAIGELLQENPPVSEDTFTAMLDLATKLDNQTLLQQCKMAHARCKETISLLRNRQSALLKARHQMEFDCQSFVDLNEILSLPEESMYLPSSAWPSGVSHSSACRRRSVCSLNSRSRDPVSRCSSIETDDESVFSESPFSSTPSKTPLEGKSSLRGIKELRESDENLRGTSSFIRVNSNFFRSSVGSDMRLSLNDSSPLRSASPSPMNNIAGSTVRAFSSGSSSSCSSSESSGPISGVKKDRGSMWRFSDLVPSNIEETNDILDDSANLLNISAGTNSHLLIRGSQINLSNSENLTQEEVRKNKTLLLIMQELIQTERDYVNSLEYIIENFLPELLREDIPQALRGQRNVIFGNIEKIYEFHSGYFLKELENCRNRPFAVGSIFLRYENQFYLYALYNKNKPKSDELMADFGSLFFKRKQMMLGDKMDLSSYLLKPVQRMGKYALLLKQLLKECEKSEEGYDELKSAQEMVQFQLRHGNDLLAMDSLRDCDVNLKEQGRLLRQGEFLVMEGSRGRKHLRHVFLFEDLILFSKSRKDPEKKNLDIFQYKQSLKTTDIGLTAQVGESPLRFEIWFRKRKPSDTFHFQSTSLEVKEAWTEEISKLLWRQALRNRKLRLHEMSSMGIGNKPCLDIRPSEDQISDRSVCISKAPPRLRLTTSASLTDATSSVRRPHSVISVSSSASSAESSTNSSAGPSFVGTLNLGFESGDSPKPLQRSVTRTSQCSAESGIITDIFPERESEENHVKVERSNSTVTNTSVDSALSPPTTLHTPCQLSPLSALEEPSNTEFTVNIEPTDQGKVVLTTEV